MPFGVDFLLDLEVQVTIEHAVADGEERGCVAFCSRLVEHIHAINVDGVALDVVHLAVVECQLGAVFSAECRVLRDGVVHLELHAHLAQRLCGIREHRRQTVGVGVVERWDETDVEVVLGGKSV